MSDYYLLKMNIIIKQKKYLRKINHLKYSPDTLYRYHITFKIQNQYLFYLLYINPHN
nr:MAG TPA: hypothetical protein [Caudoviricetes sp.]